MRSRKGAGETSAGLDEPDRRAHAALESCYSSTCHPIIGMRLVFCHIMKLYIRALKDDLALLSVVAQGSAFWRARAARNSPVSSSDVGA
jgi:hypothetical protein